MQQSISKSSDHFSSILTTLNYGSLMIFFIGLIISYIMIFFYFKPLAIQSIYTYPVQTSLDYREIFSEIDNIVAYEINAPLIKNDIELNYNTYNQLHTSKIEAIISDEMHNKGFKIRVNYYDPQSTALNLYANTLDDKYEKQAWLAIMTDNTQPFIKIETIEGLLSVRYASTHTIDHSCIQCHNNSYSLSADKQSQSSINGVLQIIQPLDTVTVDSDHLFIKIFVFYCLSLTLIYLIFIYLLHFFKQKTRQLIITNQKLNTEKNQLEQHNDSLSMVKKSAYSTLEHANIEKQYALYLNKEKSAFLASFSHEIHTSLKLIEQSIHKLITYTSLNLEQKRTITAINLSTGHLLESTGNALDFSKLELHDSKIKTVNFDLIAQCNKLHTVFLIRAEQQQLVFKFNNKTSHSKLVVNGDLLNLNRVLLNLLSNAFKFTLTGSITFTLTSLKDSIFVFEICDTGIGIKANALNKIFLPFNHSHGPFKHRLRQHQYNGPGIGLNIVKRTLNLMRSRIKVTSTLGNGSTFSFKVCLPTQKKVLSAQSAANSQSLQYLKKHNHEAPIQIVIFDLFTVEQRKLNQIISNAGFIVNETYNVEQTLGVLKKYPINILVINLSIPSVDWLSFLQNIYQKHQHLKIIATQMPLLSQKTLDLINSSLDNCFEKPYLSDAIYNVMIETLVVEFKGSKRLKSNLNVNNRTLENSPFSLPKEYADLIIELCELHLVRDIEQTISKFNNQFTGNEAYFKQLQIFVNLFDLEGLKSFLNEDSQR